MATDQMPQLNQQIEQTVVEPMRGYVQVLADHAEAVANIQTETLKAFADLGFRQARAALDVRDPKAFQEYVSQQPEIAKEIGEHMKTEAEKLGAANQALIENAQKVVQDNVSSIQKAADSTSKKVKKAASDSA